MNRSELEHIVRVSAAIAGNSHIVVVGSQSILGQFPNAPGELLKSLKADVYPKHHPERAIIIDGAIGELSLFHETFGYYAHGVAPETAALPQDWQTRAILISTDATGGATGICPEAHDLAVSKLVAGREKDLVFVASLLHHGMAQAERIAERLKDVPLADEALRPFLAPRLQRAGSDASRLNQ